MAEIPSVGSNFLAVYTFYISTLTNNSEMNRSAISRHNIPILPHYFYSKTLKRSRRKKEEKTLLANLHNMLLVLRQLYENCFFP